MAYTKNTWQNGDVITADKLNNIEDGITDRSDIFIINLTNEYDASVDDSVYRVDKTITQILEAAEAGKLLILKTYGSFLFWSDFILPNTGSGSNFASFSFMSTSPVHGSQQKDNVSIRKVTLASNDLETLIIENDQFTIRGSAT